MRTVPSFLQVLVAVRKRKKVQRASERVPLTVAKHWFQTLPQACSEIAIWRQEYNEVRPHSSLGRIPPAEFARRHRNQNQPPPASSNEIK